MEQREKKGNSMKLGEEGGALLLSYIQAMSS